MPEFLSQALIGETLRRARTSVGLSIRGLATKSGVSASHILRLESGEYDIRVSTLMKVAVCLGVPVGLALEQAIIISPGFYAKRLGEQGFPALKTLLNGDARARSRLIVFFAHCAVAVAHLLRSSNPQKIATTFSFPFPFSELENEIKRLAIVVDSLGLVDRLALMRELAEEPLELLTRENIFSEKVIKRFLKIARSREHPFSGIPNVWAILS